MKLKILILLATLFTTLPASAVWYVEFRASNGAYGWGRSLDYMTAHNRAYIECSKYSWSCTFYSSEWR